VYGYRMQVHPGGGEPIIYSRRWHQRIGKMPKIAAAGAVFCCIICAVDFRCSL
jgi:hypothetical protein